MRLMMKDQNEDARGRHHYTVFAVLLVIVLGLVPQIAAASQGSPVLKTMLTIMHWGMVTGVITVAVPLVLALADRLSGTLGTQADDQLWRTTMKVRLPVAYA